MHKCAAVCTLSNEQKCNCSQNVTCYIGMVAHLPEINAASSTWASNADCLMVTQILDAALSSEMTAPRCSKATCLLSLNGNSIKSSNQAIVTVS